METSRRVWMFVYNNCAADARVLKEAGTLRRAGHDVRIVAVLDKRTVPEETRDGVAIVRIDRNPPHYKLLRSTRRIRRRIRLRRAAGRRRWRLRRRRGRSRAAAVWSGRGLRQFRQADRGRLVRAGGRVYRAVRWRVLRASPALRRAYYRRLAPSVSERRLEAYRQAASAARDERRKERAQRRQPIVAGAAAVPRATGPDRREAIAVAVSAGNQREAVKAIEPKPPMAEERELERAPQSQSLVANAPTAWKRIDHAVSHAAYRGVMVFHRPLLFLDYYWRAFRLVRARGEGTLHAHDLNTLPVAAALALRCRQPLIYDAHELYPEVSTLSRLERRVWRIVERLLIRRASSVITVCESIAGELAGRYGIAKPEVLLNCPPWTPPPDAERNLLRERAGLDPADGPIVLYQGGFAVHRGLPELVRASAQLEHGHLILMGWGALEPELAALVAELGLQERVHFLAPVAQNELIDHTSGADIGVIPYRPVGLNNYYTTPNKLFEYIAAGIPVAGSDVPELRRFVTGLGLGATFDPSDPGDIARVLNELLEDQEGRAAMRSRALAARDQFSWERQEQVLLRVYEHGRS